MFVPAGNGIGLSGTTRCRPFWRGAGSICRKGGERSCLTSFITTKLVGPSASAEVERSATALTPIASDANDETRMLGTPLRLVLALCLNESKSQHQTNLRPQIGKSSKAQAKSLTRWNS